MMTWYLQTKMLPMENREVIHPDAFRIDVDTAERLIYQSMPVYGSESVELENASGQILRQTIVAERDQPPFNRATMDGIAVSSTGLKDHVRAFRIAGTQAAGQAAHQLAGHHECFEVMTGAVLPAGTDTVIPVERIMVNQGMAELEKGYKPEPGQFVHLQASDHAKGDSLLNPGTTIYGPQMAILTAAGKARVDIARSPSIAVISTGDELVDVGADIAEYQIRSSNDRAIETCLRLRGCARTLRARLPDDPELLRNRIQELHESNDVLILSGGVSMGKYDYVPAILKELGVRVVFHKILQRPGLPMWFGVSAANKPVFALPGNPVSTIVCCVRYVIPAIFHALGASAALPQKVVLAEDVTFKPDLTWFLPVKLNWDSAGSTLATPRPTNTSGDYIGLRDTDGFVELPRGQAVYPAGSAANLYRW
jgi:molybdopterin molybdotransferase